MPGFSTVDPTAKLKIICLEGTPQRDPVIAQFNPKEIAVDTSIPWSRQVNTKGVTELEYTGGDQRTLAFELLFDGFETGESVLPWIKKLYAMTDHVGDQGTAKRPPAVKVIWGAGTDSTDMEAFVAVIESIAVKYTMFSQDGQVLRATANVKFKDARGATFTIKKQKP